MTMKVKIGPYLNYFGPFDLARLILFWEDRDSDAVYNLGTRLATNKDGSDSVLQRFAQWYYGKRKRTIKVKIHNYDSWSADDTLAQIIHPLLVQLKEQKQGAPHVDDCDVPIHLHSTLEPADDENGIDGKWHERWDYVLDEMIWAFDQHANGSESQFYDHSECTSKDLLTDLGKLKVDQVGLLAHNKRKQNGFMLFSKYFQCLWS